MTDHTIMQQPRRCGLIRRCGILTALLFSVLIAGCGGDGSSTPPPATPDSAETTPDSTSDSGSSRNSTERDLSALEAGDDVVVTSTDVELQSDQDFQAAIQQRRASGNLKAARIPMRSDGPKSLDPIRGSTVYENQCVSQLVETLMQYKYLKRPYELEPLLLEDMPTVSDDGLTWHFKLKDGVRFHDDACFPGGKGRQVVSADVFYSWKRMADIKNSNSKVWWLIKDTIKGFDEFQEQQNAGETFDYNAPVEGFRIINDREFEVTLVKPAQSFMWKLAMFQTGIVPREAVEMYGDRFGLRPIGTGPFILKEGDWQQGQGIKFTRNENYHECYFPSEHMQSDEENGLHLGAGKRLPIMDEMQVVFYKTDQPMWLEFKAGNLDFAQVPAENFKEAFNKRTRKLTRDMTKQGMTGYPVDLLDFIFFGFNMEDSVLGGYTEEKKALRQAFCLAMDWEERNDAFYNGINVIYDGVIPPGLEGHPKGGSTDKAYRGPNLERAREMLAKAGYPEGKGLPIIDYYVARSGNGQEQSEMLRKQLAEIGITLQVHLLDFSQVMQKVDEKSAQFFSFAWGSDYPDGENNLALFYGPNEAPGANHFNYKNAEYDRLYQQIVAMPPSAERTQIYETMQGMLMEDCPYAGSMARTRFYVVTPRLKQFKPVETFDNWYKYLDVDK